ARRGTRAAAGPRLKLAAGGKTPTRNGQMSWSKYATWQVRRCRRTLRVKFGRLQTSPLLAGTATASLFCRRDCCLVARVSARTGRAPPADGRPSFSGCDPLWASFSLCCFAFDLWPWCFSCRVVITKRSLPGRGDGYQFRYSLVSRQEPLCILTVLN